MVQVIKKFWVNLKGFRSKKVCYVTKRDWIKSQQHKDLSEKNWNYTKYHLIWKI
jgi:hypothetical protein